MTKGGLLVTALVPIVLGCNAAIADTGDSGGTILPTDPRFDVFELSNSAGGHTYSSSVGTVLLSFVSKDQRYCRTARFPADQYLLLACREAEGWKIEATSNLSQAEAAYPTNFGGGNMQKVGDAVQSMMASVKPLDEFEIIEAAARGWRNPDPVDEQSFDARDILGKTALTYRASKSYIDAGTVQTVYTTKAGERIGTTRFKTAYAAPYDFRFESRMDDFGNIEVRYIAWMDRHGVDTWFSSDPERENSITSIQAAIDEAAGISRDSSGMIPGLIFPGSKLGGDIVRLTDAVRLEDEEVDGLDCFQVQGFRWPNTGQPTTVWIDKESFLIRRVYEEQELKDVATKTTWSYEPAVNVPVEEDALRFAKPAS